MPELFPGLGSPAAQAQVTRVHIPTAEFLATAIRAAATGDFHGPSWQARAFKDGMKVAADAIDQIIAEARRGR